MSPTLDPFCPEKVMKQLLFCIAIALTLGPPIQESRGQESKDQKSEQPDRSDSQQRPDRMNRRPGQAGGRGGLNQEQMIDRMFANDKNSDGKLSSDEVSGRMATFFERMDTNQDGFVTKEEAQSRMAAGRGGQGRGGQGRGRSDASGLKVGQQAPNFKLKSLDGKSQTELAAIRTKKPVVLFFGSYT